MVTRLFIALSVAALAAAVSPSSALACKCMMPTPEQAREKASAVFEGRVTSVELVPSSGEGGMGQKRVTLAVVRTWKGLKTVESVVVMTSESTASCGIDFQKDESYLVYASERDGILEAGSCGRTQPMNAAAEDLAAFGAGVTPVKVEPASADEAPKQAAPKSGGCGSVKSAAQSSLSLSLPALGLVLFGRRRAKKR